MCNMYRMTRSVDEVANLFSAKADSGANVGNEVLSRLSGLCDRGR